MPPACGSRRRTSSCTSRRPVACAESRLVADTLAWQDGDVIVRVEGDVPLARAPSPIGRWCHAAGRVTSAGSD